MVRPNATEERGGLCFFMALAMIFPLSVLLLLLSLSLSQSAWAHGFLAKEEQFAAGIPVTDNQSWPEINLIHDGASWQPDLLTFSENQIVILTLENHSDEEHLFSIGTESSLNDQAQLHRLMPDKKTNYPNTRWLPAGSVSTITWEFNKLGNFHIRCLVPAHQQKEAPTIIRVNRAAQTQEQ